MDCVQTRELVDATRAEMRTGSAAEQLTEDREYDNNFY